MKEKRPELGEKEFKKENFNPTLLAMTIGHTDYIVLVELKGICSVSEAAQPVEQVTAKDLLLLPLVTGGYFTFTKMEKYTEDHGNLLKG